MKKLLVLMVGLLVFSSAQAEQGKHEELVESYCYAESAALVCDGLQMRMDTRGKVEAIVGGEVGGPSSKYSEACRAGLAKAIEDESNGGCKKAWRDFGCSGTKVAKLIQQNPFKVSNPTLCTFGG